MRIAVIGLCLAAPLFAAAAPRIQVINEAGLAADEIAALLVEYQRWGARVFRYLQVSDPGPVRLNLTRDAGYGYYASGSVYVPPAGRSEMLETWVHELAHHATGHDASFFFKEGVAVHTLEALFAQDGRLPQGWPNYGQPTLNWARLFLERGELLPLADWLSAPLRCVRAGDGDFRLWQGYVVAGAFTGWYVHRRGMATFQHAFRANQFAGDLRELEREWLAYLRAQPAPVFDPAEHLPPGARYQAYARRLSQ